MNKLNIFRIVLFSNILQHTGKSAKIAEYVS